MNANVSFASVATASLNYPIFLRAVANARKVAEQRSTIPVLHRLLIEPVANGARITATDLDRYVSTFVPGVVDKSFTCLIDAKRLHDTLTKVKDAGSVSFTLQGETCVAVIGKLKLTIKADIPVADFPSDQDFRSKLAQSNCRFRLPTSLLLKVLNKVAFAISTEETRYYLNGVFLHYHEHRNKLVFVTTDGHRLARYSMDPPAGCEAMPSEGVIIPQASVLEMMRLLKRKGAPADTDIAVTEKGVSFSIGSEEVLESKTVDGTFPDYQRVMPPGNDRIVKIQTEAAIEAVTQASAVMTERGRAVRVDTTEGAITFTCTDPDFGTASTTVNCDAAPDVTIGFNSGYLLSILKQVEGWAEFRFSGPGDPAIVLDMADDAVTYVQMPMRV